MAFYLFKGSVTLYTGLGDDDVTVKQGQVFGEDAMLVRSGNFQVTAVTKEHTTAVVRPSRLSPPPKSAGNPAQWVWLCARRGWGGRGVERTDTISTAQPAHSPLPFAALSAFTSEQSDSAPALTPVAGSLRTQVLHKEHLEAALHMGERERQVYLPDEARIALMTPPKERTDIHMAALAAALEAKPLLAKMPPHVRQRALQHVTMQKFDSQVRSPYPPQSTQPLSHSHRRPPSLPGAPQPWKSPRVAAEWPFHSGCSPRWRPRPLKALMSC